MRFVTASAAVKAHGSVLECEWTALVAVAAETAGLIGGERLSHNRADTPVRIVAIDAGHRSLRQPVMIGLLELRPDAGMATSALLVDPGRLAYYQSVGPVAMDFVTSRAGDRVFGMAALQAPDVCRLVEVASETNAIGGCGRELRWIAD